VNPKKHFVACVVTLETKSWHQTPAHQAFTAIAGRKLVCRPICVLPSAISAKAMNNASLWMMTLAFACPSETSSPVVPAKKIAIPTKTVVEDSGVCIT
jgi:hypothetical protein